MKPRKDTMKLSTPAVSSRSDGTRCVSGSARVCGATSAHRPTYSHPARPYIASARETSRTTLMTRPPRTGLAAGAADARIGTTPRGEVLGLPFNLLHPPADVSLPVDHRVQRYLPSVTLVGALAKDQGE